MVANFLRGGAAINVLARAVGAKVVVADLGVKTDIEHADGLITTKIRRGTASITQGPAMTREEAGRAIEAGRELVRGQLAEGMDVAITGDMGIGNTTASAAVVCALTDLDPEAIVGRGTGVDDAGLQRKRGAVREALQVNAAAVAGDPEGVLAAVGGLEIAGLVGVILESAAARKPVIIDGFISGAAALVASRMAPTSTGFMIASHRSHELGHRAVLEQLGLQPLLDLELRLGEGTGGALALPIVRAAMRLLNDMATFESAGVSDRI
jgi:nicotinate-nucleotide--dimethylbenzimidazole phosphoribosyltransferase